ncbi:hypothetical protein WJX73_008451 [Symbiochloris irregularis]|uniref:VTT domain-containing protein n=1 Tax=Symbiochloris irregularis TaxID=706552 RepID=A0AAW1PLE8_9CHLO
MKCSACHTKIPGLCRLSPSRGAGRLTALAELLGILATLGAVVPGPAGAAELLPASLIGSWLDYLEAMGPVGPLVCVAVIAAAEMVPLAPTPPLTLASGLAFGAVKGTACTLVGVNTAALLAFTLARTFGKPWAAKLAEHELGSDSNSAAQPMQAALARIQQAISEGSFWQQVTAVTLLRLTPIIPFSASNYLLGFTPLGYVPYMTGTLAGMTVWSTVYASLGGASRVLLQEHQTSLESVLAGVGDTLSMISQDAAVVALVMGMLAAASWASGLLGPKAP